MCQFSFSDAEKKLLALQQQIRALKIPVVIVLEGWCGAGKGTMAGELLEGLDGCEAFTLLRLDADNTGATVE